MDIFLLAHPDDEIFALPLFNNYEFKLVIYLTTGFQRHEELKFTAKRINEVKNIFNKNLAPFNAELLWWGLSNEFYDEELHKFSYRKNIESLALEIKSYGKPVAKIITTAFEGAHQDHDSAAYISREIGKILNLTPIEVSTYPQKFSQFYSFSVLKPRTPGDAIVFKRLPVTLLALKLIFGYKSQRLTWLGLGPFVLIRYGFKKFRVSVPIKIGKLDNCLYEFRGRAKQKEVLAFFEK